MDVRAFRPEPPKAAAAPEAAGHAAARKAAASTAKELREDVLKLLRLLPAVLPLLPLQCTTATVCSMHFSIRIYCSSTLSGPCRTRYVQQCFNKHSLRHFVPVHKPSMYHAFFKDRMGNRTNS